MAVFSMDNKASMKAVLNSISDSAVIANTEDEIVFINDAAIAMWGYAFDELHGKTIEFLYSNKKEYEKRERERYHVAAKVEQQVFETEYMRKDGSVFVAETLGAPLRDNQSKRIGYLGIHRDMSDRRSAELDLIDTKERFRSLYEKTPIMLHSINGDGKIVAVSDYWLAMMGYRRDEVLGRSSTEFLSSESQLRAKRIVLPEFFKRGFCHDISFQFIKKSGEIIDGLFTAIAERDAEGEIVRTLAVIVDVTEKLQSERAKENLISELQTAVEKIKTLEGILPICMHCKMIRDSKGLWTEIEQYLPDHSEATLSHGICPECRNLHYPKYKEK